MTVEEAVGKPRENITLEDINALAGTYDWELVDTDDALNLYFQLKLSPYIQWLNEMSVVAALGTEYEIGFLSAIKKVKEKYLSLIK